MTRTVLHWTQFLVAVPLAAILIGCSQQDPAKIEVAGYPECVSGSVGSLTIESSSALKVIARVSDRNQEISGFGASDCWSTQFVGQWPLEKREAIADLLFDDGLDTNGNPKGIGLSIWRFNLGAGSSRKEHISTEWRRADSFFTDDYSGYDWDRLPGQRWFLYAAQLRGVDRFVLFANSPPITMTKNGRAFCDSNSGTTNLADGMAEDYSSYLVDVVSHFREVEDIEFDVLSPFNEPQWDWEKPNQEGCRYSSMDIKEVVDALDRVPGLGNTEIDIPESGSIVDLWSGENYLEAFFGPDSATSVRGKVAPRISSHSYKIDTPVTGLVERRKELRATLARYPGIAYSMTEYCVLGPHGRERDLGMDTALQVARMMHVDLVVGGAINWQWWLAVSPYDYKDGLVYIDQDTRDGQFYESKTLWAMGNFSRFVRPGMVRVGVERSDGATAEDSVEGLMVSSFLDQDLGLLATIFINWSGDSIPIEFSAPGLHVENWIPFVTNPVNDLHAYQAVAAGRSFNVPARSVVTLVGRSQSPPDEML